MPRVPFSDDEESHLLSRIRILALFATLLALATALAACGGGGEESGSGEDPQKVVEGASLEGVTSGELEVSLNVKAEGKKGGDFHLELSGPFEAGEEGELPQLEMRAKASGSAQGENIDFDGGITLLTDRAFIRYEGESYEVDPTTFGFLKSNFEQAQQQGGEEADVTACQKAAEGIEFSQFTDNLSNEGGEDVGGATTTKVSGDLSISGAVDALIQLTEDPACSSQLEALGPLPPNQLESAKDELSKAIKKAHVELWVGDDEIIRKLALELTVEPPEAAGEKVELELEATLDGVNEEQSFSQPAHAKPLEALFKQLGVNPLEFLEAGGAEGGLGGLLEGLGGASGGSEGSSSEGGSSAELENQAYVECLQGAETAKDLQKCASLLK
jgi:hypothetical protein